MKFTKRMRKPPSTLEGIIIFFMRGTTWIRICATIMAASSSVRVTTKLHTGASQKFNAEVIEKNSYIFSRLNIFD